jgi:hypothetical protein
MSTYAYTAAIYWNATLADAVLVGNELHGTEMDTATHIYNHRTRGTQYDSGLAITPNTIGGNGSSNAHAQIGVASGVIRDEDIALTLSAVADPATLPVMYRSGAAGDWTFETNTGYPVLTTGTGRLSYNQFTGGAWQKTEIGNGDYVLYHIYATNDVSTPLKVVMGQAEYATLNAAQTGATTEAGTLSVGGIAFTEWRLIGTIIYQTQDSYTNAVNARIVATGDGASYVDWRTNEIQQGVVSGNHNSLSGLQGGAAADYQHLTAAQVAGLSALTTTQIASLTTAQANAMTTASLEALASMAVKGMTTTQLASLSSTQIGALTGVQMQGLTTVASSATCDIWAPRAQQINLTGTAAIASLGTAPVAGATRTMICADACSFTHNTAAINVPAASTFTAAAGDIVTAYALTTTTFRLGILKADGSEVIPPAVTAYSGFTKTTPSPNDSAKDLYTLSCSSTSADATGSITFGHAQTIRILAVAGGGSGGGNSNNTAGGGGGGGGVYYATALAVTAKQYNAVAGEGGGGSTSTGTSGGNTTFTDLTDLVGGGRGGASTAASAVGGSGGGANADSNTTGSAGTNLQGCAGGNSANGLYGGGGGGAGSTPGSACTGGAGATASGTGGNGGAGFSCDISGTAVYYGCGGGGGTAGTNQAPTGGSGSSGTGGEYVDGGGDLPGSGNHGRGNGGGGSAYNYNQASPAGSGGGGCIIIEVTR